MPICFFFVANFKCALFCPIFCRLSCHNEVFQSIIFVQFLHILLKIQNSSLNSFYKIELNFVFLISRITLIMKLKGSKKNSHHVKFYYFPST
jgi:hypothetical protein